MARQSADARSPPRIRKLRAGHARAERELEAAEAAICRERTPIFNGTERLTIADRIRWLGDKQTDANELGAVDSALRGERVPLMADDGGALTPWPAYAGG